VKLSERKILEMPKFSKLLTERRITCQTLAVKEALVISLFIICLYYSSGGL
jgi:hypothetical protein